jgi:hypothetical protein
MEHSFCKIANPFVSLRFGMDFLKFRRVYKLPINFGPEICGNFALIYDEHHRNSDIVSAVLTKLKLTASN